MSIRVPVRFEDGRPMLLAGLRRRHLFDGAETGIAGQWREFLAADPVPTRVGTHYYGVMCGSDGEGIEYMCGVEVESFGSLPEGLGRVRVPPQQYAVFAHDRCATSLRPTWAGILGWLSGGPWESAEQPDFERYGPDSDPTAPGEGVEVWVGVVPRRERSDGATGSRRT